MFYVYILKCNDNTLYTGYTNNLDNRLQMHNEGLGAKYTRGRLPVTLLYKETFDNKSDAMKREYAIKQLSRQSKLKLIENGKDDFMHKKSHKLFSKELKRETHFNSYGNSEKVMLMFLSSKDQKYDLMEDKMIDGIKDYINNGLITVYTFNTIDDETWFDDKKTIYEKVELNEVYTSYIVNEVVPYIKDTTKTKNKMIVSGFKLGAFMSANLYFKNPKVFDSIITLSGIYDIRSILGDDIEGSSVFFSSPVDYLSVINNPKLLNELSKGNIILADKQDDSNDLKSISLVLERKNIKSNIDYWQNNQINDDNFWIIQMQHYLSKLVKKGLLNINE